MYKENHCPLILFTTQNDRLLGHFRVHCTQCATPSLYLQVERDQPSHMHTHTRTCNHVVRIVHNTKALQTPEPFCYTRGKLHHLHADELSAWKKCIRYGRHCYGRAHHSDQSMGKQTRKMHIVTAVHHGSLQNDLS